MAFGFGLWASGFWIWVSGLGFRVLGFGSWVRTTSDLVLIKSNRPPPEARQKQ